MFKAFMVHDHMECFNVTDYTTVICNENVKEE